MEIKKVNKDIAKLWLKQIKEPEANNYLDSVEKLKQYALIDEKINVLYFENNNENRMDIAIVYLLDMNQSYLDLLKEKYNDYQLTISIFNEENNNIFKNNIDTNYLCNTNNVIKKDGTNFNVYTYEINAKFVNN